MKDIKRRNLIVIRRIIVSIAVRLLKSNILGNLYDYLVIPTNQSAKLYNTLPPAAASGCVLVFGSKYLNQTERPHTRGHMNVKVPIDEVDGGR